MASTAWTVRELLQNRRYDSPTSAEILILSTLSGKPSRSAFSSSANKMFFARLSLRLRLLS
jgi:hypothetical protein